MKTTDSDRTWLSQNPWRPSFRTTVIIFACLSFFSFSDRASADGEIFELQTNGTEYCGDFDSAKFNKRNAVPFWIRVDGNTQLTVSFTATFEAGTTFPMSGFFYQTTKSKGAFIAGVLFVDGSFATIQGESKFDKDSGRVKSLKGVFVQSGLIFDECFSSGKFKTGKRLN